MNFDEMKAKAIEVRKKYDQLNAKHGVKWEVQDLMAGFVGDVGDLSKIIMAKQGLREMKDVDAKLAHELADCLWSVIILADKLQIDLAAEFQKTMKELDARIGQSLEA